MLNKFWEYGQHRLDGCFFQGFWLLYFGFVQGIVGAGGLLWILQGSAGLFLPGLPCLEPWSTAPMCMLTRAYGALRSVHDYKYGRIIYIFVHFFPRILVEVGVGLRRRREEAGPSLGVPPPVSLFTRVVSLSKLFAKLLPAFLVDNTLGILFPYR
jgi:hypothetical protein